MSTTADFDDAPKIPSPSFPARRCRALRVNGLQCNATAILGQPFCHTHGRYRNPECPKKGSRIVMPLLEDHSSIQLVLSQVAHGLFSGDMDPAHARSLAYTCQVAAQTLPRPIAWRVKAADQPAPVEQPVAQVFTSPEGEPLGPDQPWSISDGTPAAWSFDKWLLSNTASSSANLPSSSTARRTLSPPAGSPRRNSGKTRATIAAFATGSRTRFVKPVSRPRSTASCHPSNPGFARTPSARVPAARTPA